MRTFALVLEYDGTGYSGFQLQQGLPTVQGELEAALGRLTGEQVRIRGAGRTDAGVHARGQVVAFSTGLELSIDAVRKGLNRQLPDDIAVKEAYLARDGFDPRREAVSREYRYLALNSQSPSPLLRLYSYLVKKPLNIKAMQVAAASLVGEHDFASFTVDLAGTGKSSLRKVFRVEVGEKRELVYFDIEADAFLPHQVRRTIGALLRVGDGKMSPEQFGQLLDTRQPNLARPAAPARGLYLMKVNYRQPLADMAPD